MSQANQFRACAVVLAAVELASGVFEPAPFVLLVLFALADSLVRYALHGKHHKGAV